MAHDTRSPAETNSGGSNMPPRNPSSQGMENPESFWKRNKKRLIAVGAAVTASAAVATATYGLGARGNNDKNAENPGPRPTTSQSLEPSPSSKPSTTPEQSVAPIEKDDSEKMEYLRSIEKAEDFNQLPRSERLKFVAWEYYQIEQGDKRAFFNQPSQQLVPGNEETGDPGIWIYDFNPYNSVFPERGATKLDDGQKIVDHVMWFGYQVERAQAADPNNLDGPVDIEAALKMASGRSYYVDDKHPALTAGTYDEIEHFTRQEKKTGVLSVAERYTATKFSPQLQKGVDAEGKTIEFKDVEYVSHGQTTLGRFVFESVSLKITDPVTNKVKEIVVDMWIPYSNRDQRLPN